MKINKFWFGVLLAMVSLPIMAASPSLNSFNTNQFGTTTSSVSVKSGATMTNIAVATGVTTPAVTATGGTSLTLTGGTTLTLIAGDIEATGPVVAQILVTTPIANDAVANLGTVTITNGLSQPVLSTNITAQSATTNFMHDFNKGERQYFDMTTVGADINWTAFTNVLSTTNYQEIGYTFKGDGTHKMTFGYLANTQPWTPTNSIATNGFIPLAKLYKMAVSIETVSGLYTNIAYVVQAPNQ